MAVTQQFFIIFRRADAVVLNSCMVPEAIGKAYDSAKHSNLTDCYSHGACVKRMMESLLETTVRQICNEDSKIV